MYTVKEIFFTLQGEGANTGRPSGRGERNRVEARLSPGRSRTRAIRGFSVHSLVSPANGRIRPGGEHARRDRLLSRASAVALERPVTQSSWLTIGRARFQPGGWPRQSVPVESASAPRSGRVIALPRAGNATRPRQGNDS